MNYFDTAYVYHGGNSEKAIREALVRRWPRDRFMLATKLPAWCMKTPEDRDRIFDRFFTGDRAHTSGKGTGLGLSICQRIMEMHGQTIRLLDTAEGAAFRFTLEYAPDGKNLTETEKNA